MILEALHRIAVHRESLSREEARTVVGEILTGKCSDAQIAGLLVALHMKGETVEEIVGFAEAIRATAMQLVPSIVYEPPTASVGAMLVPPFTVVHVAVPVTSVVAG